MQASILVSDKQTIARKGIISILQEAFDVKDVGLSENSEPHQLTLKISQLQPSLVIADYLQHQDSIKTLKEIRQKSPKVKWLIVSHDEEIHNIKKAIKLGVEGYLTKYCESDEVINAVKLIMKGKRFFCPSITERLLDYEKQADTYQKSLSRRELEILTLIAKGNTTNQIADKLFISVHTVNSHRKNILKKLGLKSPIELVTYAFDQGLVD